MQNDRDSNERKDSCHQPKNGHNGIKHALMMALCCLGPLALAFGLKAAGFGTAAGYLMLLLCPLMHIFMMRDMHKGRDQARDNTSSVVEKSG